MYPRYQVSVKDISQNKNSHVHRERKALPYANFKSLDHISDNIYRIEFNFEGKEVIFLAYIYHPKWIVSECDDFIIGSGVLKKVFDVTD